MHFDLIDFKIQIFENIFDWIFSQRYKFLYNHQNNLKVRSYYAWPMGDSIYACMHACMRLKSRRVCTNLKRNLRAQDFTFALSTSIRRYFYPISKYIDYTFEHHLKIESEYYPKLLFLNIYLENAGLDVFNF
jgi:hypothetical protein